MNYFLYKLAFTTPVHFGPSNAAQSLYRSKENFCADTLFSALCHSALSVYGQNGLDSLIRETRDGDLLLSDGMPWSGETFYLPKPFLTSKSQQEVPTRLRKAVKKLAWIPIDAFDTFTESLRGGKPYDPEKYPEGFGSHVEITKAAIPSGKDAEPYQVGLYAFEQDKGLYFIAGCQSIDQKERLTRLVKNLGLSGIGGKTSSGYGKFVLDSVIDLKQAKNNSLKNLAVLLESDSKTEQYFLLTTSLPSDQELDTIIEGASYQLLRRSGFVQSYTAGSNPVKKKTQYFLKAGSVLPRRFSGELYDVGASGMHPVYRYSFPLLLGVELC
jgi:CRISPR-associated protein Csm4